MSRRVRICTISLNSLVHSARRASKEEIFREAESKIELGALDKPDLFLLPEVCLLNGTPESWIDPGNIEQAGNDTYQRLGEAARAHNAYIAAPLLTREDGRVYNSTVILNREGEPVYTYHKAHPTAGELNERGITAGTRTPRPWDAPFGRVGVAICYDLKFQPLLKHYYLDSVVVPYLENEEAVRAAKRTYGPAVETEIHRPEGDMIVRYRGTETTVKDLMREFGIVTRAEAFNNEHLV